MWSVVCDICGHSYNDNKKDSIKIKAKIVGITHELGEDGFGYKTEKWIPFDICPECKKLMFEWINDNRKSDKYE